MMNDSKTWTQKVRVVTNVLWHYCTFEFPVLFYFFKISKVQLKADADATNVRLNVQA